MRTSQLINTKSLVLQCRERREQKFISAAIRKTLLITARVVYLTSQIEALLNNIKLFYSKPIKIGYLDALVHNEPLLLPEGKPHLNPNVVQVAAGVNFRSGKPIVQLIDKNGNREQIIPQPWKY